MKKDRKNDWCETNKRIKNESQNTHLACQLFFSISKDPMSTEFAYGCNRVHIDISHPPPPWLTTPRCQPLSERCQALSRDRLGGLRNVRASRDLSGSLRISRGLSGSLRKSQGLSGSLCISQNLSGSHWISQDLSGPLGISQEVLGMSGSHGVSQSSSGSLGKSEDLSGSLRISQEFWGSLRKSQDLSESLRKPSELSGSLRISQSLSGTLSTPMLTKPLWRGISSPLVPSRRAPASSQPPWLLRPNIPFTFLTSFWSLFCPLSLSLFFFVMF